MAKFIKLTRPAVKNLEAGQSICEHGIIAKRTAKGDVTYAVNMMVDGKRIHKGLGTASAGVTREQAEQLVEALRTRAREHRLNLPKGRKIALSFAQAARDYLARLVEEGGKAVDRKDRHLRARLVPFFAHTKIDGVTGSEVKRFARQRQSGGAKPGTVNRELATLSHMMRSAARWGWITRDQVPDATRLKEGAGRIIALTPEQCRALLEAAKGDQDPDLWLFVSICLQTSMRHGEARKLRWEHFDANRRRFFIPEAKAGERDQPIPVDLTATLSGVQSQRGATEGFVFKAGPGSRTECRHTFRKAFRRAAIRARLDPAVVTPHVLRHTAITKLIKAGVDLPTVQRVSGHKTLAMVLRYSHIDGLHIDNAVDHLRM